MTVNFNFLSVINHILNVLLPDTDDCLLYPVPAAIAAEFTGTLFRVHRIHPGKQQLQPFFRPLSLVMNLCYW